MGSPTSTEPVTVAVADVNPAVVEAIRSLLAADERVCLVGSAGDAEALDRLLGDRRPAVLIVDLSIFGRGAVDHLWAAAAEHPGMGIVLVDLLDVDGRYPARGSGGGVVVLSKLAPPGDWIEAVLAVAGCGHGAGSAGPPDAEPSARTPYDS